MTIDEVYPEHTEALERVGNPPKNFPTCEDPRLKEEERKTNKEEEKDKRMDFRTIYFVLSH
eukprot:8599550-Ditylum_brightwellii.AAC.1